MAIQKEMVMGFIAVKVQGYSTRERVYKKMDQNQAVAVYRASQLLEMQRHFTAQNVSIVGILALKNPFTGQVVEYEAYFNPLATLSRVDGKCPFNVRFGSNGTQIITIKPEWVSEDKNLVEREI